MLPNRYLEPSFHTINMSFQQFGDSFQGQQPSDEAAPGSAGAQPQQPPMGQPMDGQQGQFPGAPQGAAGAPSSAQPSGDAKTTLWCVSKWKEQDKTWAD